MRSRIAVLLGGVAVAGAAFYRAIRRTQPPAPPPPAPDRHAEELRAKLDQSRNVVAEREEFEGAEVPVDHVEEVAPDVGDRRRAVHERGRQVAEQMRHPGPRD